MRKAAGHAEGPQGQNTSAQELERKTALYFAWFSSCAHICLCVCAACMHVCVCVMCHVGDTHVQAAVGVDTHGCAHGCRGQRSNSDVTPQESSTLLIEIRTLAGLGLTEEKVELVREHKGSDCICLQG